MSKKLVMGNAAMAFGAIHAGVNLVTGYPGTPSTEILETIAKNNPGDIYVEWSVNEKVALEVAAGASYAGARVLVTMKQVGLNVAADPLMSLNYVGIKGGMVIVVADDPGPISSQTEQDTRHFAKFAKLMVFDPVSPAEAYEMMQDAFEYSEKYGEPVIFRPTTRVCHGYQTVELKQDKLAHKPEGFVKDSSRWVIFPRLSYLNHIKLEEKMVKLSEDFSTYRFNSVIGSGKKGIAASGISYEYVKEVIGNRTDIKVMKLATVHPFPNQMAVDFLTGLDQVLVVEELDPVMETALVFLCGRHHLGTDILGKLTGHVINAGENTVLGVGDSIRKFLGEDIGSDESVINAGDTLSEVPKTPQLPLRPPVLCAGCPHRASFYGVKKAMKGKKANFSGDIGCYTLGNAKPLDMVDTCLCMGADVTIAQGLWRIEPDAYNFAFIGDSTFFAAGITGVVNAVYNEADLVLMVLDNSTTAMTGHQPHPGTGKTMMGNIVDKISIENVLKGIGVTSVVTIDALDLDKVIETVKEVIDQKGVKVIICKSPCIAVVLPGELSMIDQEKCINCKKCITELGCPAIVLKDGIPFIEDSLCYGCDLCRNVCPVGAIGGVNHD